MKFKTIILFIALGLFVVQPANVLKADSVSDILGKTLGKGKELIGKQKIKGKKLKAFILNNVITVDYEGKKQSYKFNKNTYEVYEDGKIVGDGTWAIKGLTKSSIKLSGYRDIYFQIYKAKDRISTLTNLKKDNDERTNRKILGIASPTDFEKQLAQVEPEKQKALEEKKEAEEEKKLAAVETKKEKKTQGEQKKTTTALDKLEAKKLKDPKAQEEESEVAAKKKITIDENDSSSKKKDKKSYKYEEMSKKNKQKLKKLAVQAEKHTKVIKKNENEIHVLQTGKFLMFPSHYRAVTHCAQFKKFAFAFGGYLLGERDPVTDKASEYYACSKDFIFVSPLDGSKIVWSNYDDPSLYKYPDKHIYLYRNLTKISKKKIKDIKVKDPNFFEDKKDKVYTVYHKDENTIHIKGKLLSLTNLKEREIASEHCAKYDKYYYYFSDDFVKGKKNSMLFYCKKTLTIPGNKLTFTNDPTQYGKVSTASTQSSSNKSLIEEIFSPSNIQNTQQSGGILSQSIDKKKLKLYNASSSTTYYFFDSSSNFMSALEHLYRAYDQNTEADKLAAQITYLKESKSSEGERLKSTLQIVDDASVKITGNINDASLVLSDMGRGYYEQSLPYVFSAAQSAYHLFMTIKNTKEKVTSSGDLLTGLMDNLGEVIGIGTILPKMPEFSKSMITTSKLIFTGAKSKKIRDKGNLGKALNELNLDL
jgi:hypothetical protein